MSLLFWGNFNGAISFNSQALLYFTVGTTANYNIYQMDVSNYAGQTGQLLFSAPYGYGGSIDNIQFSTTAVPEPGTLALAVLGASLLGFRRWRNLLAH